MCTVSVRVLLILFVLIGGGAANAQTTTATFPQKEEIIELGETWPDTPVLSGLKTEIEKHWVQQGGFWFLRVYPNSPIRQIGNVFCRLERREMLPEDQTDGIHWRGRVSFEWKQERFFVQDRKLWTPWRTGDVIRFEVTVKAGTPVFQMVKPFMNPALQAENNHPAALTSEQITIALDNPTVPNDEAEWLMTFAYNSFWREPIPDVRAKLLTLPKAEYSPEGRANNISGKVVLAVQVLADGSPCRITVVRSLGYGLDEKAVEAARQARFAPARRNGNPVTASARVEVHFKIPEVEPADTVKQ